MVWYSPSSLGTCLLCVWSGTNPRLNHSSSHVNNDSTTCAVLFTSPLLLCCTRKNKFTFFMNALVDHLRPQTVGSTVFGSDRWWDTTWLWAETWKNQHWKIQVQIFDTSEFPFFGGLFAEKIKLCEAAVSSSSLMEVADEVQFCLMRISYSLGLNTGKQNYLCHGHEFPASLSCHSLLSEKWDGTDSPLWCTGCLPFLSPHKTCFIPFDSVEGLFPSPQNPYYISYLEHHIEENSSLGFVCIEEVFQ